MMNFAAAFAQGEGTGTLEARRWIVGYFLIRRREGGAVETESRQWVLAPEAFRRLLEERVGARFGMSLTEFADAFRAGKLDDDPAAYELAVASGASARRD
jgi:hypothetical protein